MNGQQGCAAAKTAEHILGIVLTLDRAAGALTLGRVGGKRSQLAVPPHLLGDVRSGTPVQVVVEGATVRMLRCLWAPARAARARPDPAPGGPRRELSAAPEEGAP